MGKGSNLKKSQKIFSEGVQTKYRLTVKTPLKLKSVETLRFSQIRSRKSTATFMLPFKGVK
jgi:hypothetical protein